MNRLACKSCFLCLPVLTLRRLRQLILARRIAVLMEIMELVRCPLAMFLFGSCTAMAGRRCLIAYASLCSSSASVAGCKSWIHCNCWIWFSATARTISWRRSTISRKFGPDFEFGCLLGHERQFELQPTAGTAHASAAIAISAPSRHHSIPETLGNARYAPRFPSIASDDADAFRRARASSFSTTSATRTWTLCSSAWAWGH